MNMFHMPQSPRKRLCQGSVEDNLVVKPRFQKEKCRFCISCETVYQLFTFAQICEGPWECNNPVYMCFVDL